MTDLSHVASTVEMPCIRSFPDFQVDHFAIAGIKYLPALQSPLSDQYGPPGLDFNEINVKGINNYLEQGFNGKETVYYRNGRPVSSRLTTSYYPDSPKTTTLYRFTTESLINRLFKKLLGTRDRYDEVKNIDLSSVFKGLRSGLE